MFVFANGPQDIKKPNLQKGNHFLLSCSQFRIKETLQDLFFDISKFLAHEENNVSRIYRDFDVIYRVGLFVCKIYI